MPKCKVCGSDLVKKRTKSGEIVLYCTDCKKVYKLPAKPVVEEDEDEEEEEEVVKKPAKEVKLPKKPVVEEEDDDEDEEEEDDTPKCKLCGNKLVVKKTKSGEEVLYCTSCKKAFKKPAPKPVEEDEDEEEEEEKPVVAPTPKVEEKKPQKKSKDVE